VKNPKALVLYGDGINCELETEFALKMADFETTLIHTSQLLKEPHLLKKYQLLVLPGGFSFGDEIASGKVLAIKLKEHVQELLSEFVAAGSLLLATCNGFQVLVQMGLLPSVEPGQGHKSSLVRNQPTQFSNRWVTLDVAQSTSCQFLDGLKTIELPIRHGEGRLVVEPSQVEFVKRHGCLRYRLDVNGSFDRIAGLTNAQGNVFGLMPHPEAFVRWTQHPAWTEKIGQRLVNGDTRSHTKSSEVNSHDLPDGLAIFKNAAKAILKG
jgi:phosphoribosylformylglycinamidine synthase subunit PurQ / glutaminase